MTLLDAYRTFVTLAHQGAIESFALDLELFCFDKDV